jgi:aspartate-semialdehyde dehydrogenase
MDSEIPLVVPEVNSAAIEGHNGIIANPNCSTIIMVVALQPIHALSPLLRVTVSTYQAASGAGAKGMDALQRELAGEELEDSPFPHRLAGNLIPRIDVMQDNGYTKEEMKMVLETQKIMGLPNLSVSATCVRVPVARTHSESIQVTTESPLELGAIRAAFDAAPGLEVIDEPGDDKYPTPLAATGADDVYVGRLRAHPAEASTYDFWVVGDQILKGAALNAVQIAEKAFESRTA